MVLFVDFEAINRESGLGDLDRNLATLEHLLGLLSLSFQSLWHNRIASHDLLLQKLFLLERYFRNSEALGFLYSGRIGCVIYLLELRGLSSGATVDVVGQQLLGGVRWVHISFSVCMEGGLTKVCRETGVC